MRVSCLVDSSYQEEIILETLFPKHSSLYQNYKLTNSCDIFFALIQHFDVVLDMMRMAEN